MDFHEHREIIKKLKRQLTTSPSYDMLSVLLSELQYTMEDNPKLPVDERDFIMVYSGFIKKQATMMYVETMEQRWDDLYWRTVLFEAPYLFESYLIYMEKDRNPGKRFYLPRRKTLKVVVDDLQDLEDRKLDFYGLSMPSRVGKSTICIFFLAWVAGKRPNSHSAMGGHSGKLAKGFYGELLNLVNTREYKFSEIFPDSPLQKTSAEDLEINLDEPDRFATITCRGIDGTWTGAVDVSADGYLYVDDLIRDREHSLNPIRMENTYQEYLNKMVDRKNDGARELMVGTRWNIIDPLGKIEKENAHNPRYRFRKIPALNEKGESNFQYEVKGFSTQYYIDMKGRLDKNEWEAKFMQNPFVREGLLFPEEELRFFFGILPASGFVRVVTACDVAWGGGDSTSMPIGFEYENGDVYIVDWVFNRGAKEVTIPIVEGKIVGNKIQQINFEANNGGEMYAKYVDDDLIRQGYKCSITSTKAPGKMAKMAKIIQYSGDIKRRFIFLAPNRLIKEAAKNDPPGIHRYMRNQEYDEAMDELTKFVQIGDNEHDDSPDSLSQLERFLEGGFTAEVKPIPRPF
ncbi:hypothetical protein [Enterocloster lavalensis]|uniref:hypothetical protein n=1 Tax=Enterocloster lavalensis TaxID=460384 RepID=UPI001D07FB9B|nr:hypothetical protein [Enterocloster lavalensis]MCB6343669.1 hypothetical protein [Enterocloster lavalensis]